MTKLTTFVFQGRVSPVRFIETLTIKEGVTCDTYAFTKDDTKDLAVVQVKKGYKTPLQRVLSGDKTIEGFLEGQATLTILESSGKRRFYEFGPGQANKPVIVKVGQLMQWQADKNSDFVFYEICQPPYKEGRFENLPE